MKKKVFSLMMMLLLAVTGFVRADELTVNDDTTTNGYVPVYGFYADAYLKCEFVQPAADLAAVSGGTINSLTFFASDSNVSWGSANFQVFVTEVANASISAFAGPGTVVYTGALSIANGQMVVNFTTPYTYNGGNLLVGVYNTVEGSYVSCSWYGVSASGASVQGYSYSSLDAITATQRNFLPKMKIDYTAGGGGGGIVEDQLHVRYMDGADEVIDTLNLGVRPMGCWTEPFAFQMYTEGPAYTVNVLDFTPSDGMFFVEGEELPFQVVRTSDVDLVMGTNATQVGLIERQFVAITEGDRAAHIWPVTVEIYDPLTPDVWEKACTEATTFPFVEVPARAHNVTLHNDYTLPFPEIEEGLDAVYKLVFDNDMMLNAEVTYGENGKVALYREGFEGEGGPMADNYYTGPSANGGGASGGSFEAMIGDETSTLTSTYFPFHTLWNYSIGENLFLASELNEAGVTTAPMTSLSWYVSSSTCTTAQNGISIWMANVSDSELTATSHTTAGMTLVYSGTNVLPVAGEWNEFEFNAGSFAWDGHSNVLVVCQRLNGDWQGSISWQTHNPGFTAMAYDYDDYEVYDMTSQTYSMYTSATNRANIIFKGGNRDNRSILTVYPGTDYNEYIPVYGYYTDSDICSQYIIPAADLSAMNGGTITNLSYNLETPAAGPWTGCNFKVYMKEVGYTTMTELVNRSQCTVVYTGSLNGTGSTMNINLTTPYTYNGGNLLIGIDLDEGGDTYEDAYFYGSNTSYVSALCGYSWGGLEYGSNFDYEEQFIPTTVFTYTGGGSTPSPTPSPELPEGIAYGPVITNAAVEAGTYYLVASSTTPDFEVTINAEPMPCPAVEGFAFGPTPADDDDDVEPGSVTLRWNIPDYATGWRLVFGSTYYPDPTHPQTVIYPEDGSFSTTLANSYTVRNLWNNTNYFWHVEFNNGACQDGVSSPIWGFTTHLNIPQNLVAEDYTVFDDEQIVLHWNAVVDRTFRTYFIYRDGEKVGETNTNQIDATSFTDGPLAYNMGGYTYYVTAIYDEGESHPSDPVTVKVSGYGDVNGHVYEQDGTTGIAGATVTMVGTDEFGVSHTYNFVTNGQGYYSGHIYAGSYNGSAACDGYQTIDAPVQGNPIAINYDETTSPIDYILDENFDAPCAVIAEYYPDSLDPNSPYVKVYWGCGLPGSEIIEDFETGDFSKFDWQLDNNYPWSVTTYQPYEGTYCMKSGGAGVANVVSNMSVTVEIPADGLMSFFGKISCESSWDYGYFYIDGVQKGSYTGASNWAERQFEVTAGEHTFMWQYTKDGSVNSNDDCFYVDYINFYKQPEPPVPGMTYDFENSTLQGWTNIDADGDGNVWLVASDVMTSQPGHNSSNDFVISQSYYMGEVLYPDNYLVSPQVQLGGVLRFYACAQDNLYAAEHFGVAVSTTSNSDPSAFTMLQEWTMSAKSVAAPAGKAIKDSRSGREQGNWYEYTVDLSAYSGMGYVAIRHFNCSDMFYLDVDDITIGEPGGKGFGETRSLSHYNVYRTNCYNDGPYTEENTVFLATVWVPDTVYMDVEWYDLPAGVYKWGVSAVYAGNRGEEVESPISWAAPAVITRDATADNDPNPVPGEEGVRAPWDLMHTFSAPEAAQYGVVTDGQYIYTSNWGYASAAHNFYKYDMQGNMIEGFEITGCGTLRGMTFDGQYVYGVANSNTVYCVDLNNHTLINTFTSAYGAMRGITYDPERDGFWVIGNWSGNLTLINRSGAIVTTGPEPSSASDLAYYKDENNVEHVYCFNNGDNGVYDYNIAANTLGGSVFNFSAVPGFASGTSGGCHVAEYNGKVAFFGDIQQDPNLIGIYELRDSGAPAPGPTPGPTPVPGAHGLAEPRQSEIVWSNCLDKDMYLDHVSVNVLLNSADSPEGTTVSFTNLNEYEQMTYGGYDVTLDESGYYLWDNFRKGEYGVKVEHVGYEPIVDTVSIWETTDLRYVMIEIIYGVENVYVSRTGWAMWDPLDPQQGGSGINPGPNPGPTPGPGGNGDSFNENFDGGMPAGWTAVDADGDGYNWVSSMTPGNYHNAGVDLTGTGHNASAAYVISGSYANGTGQALNPDNYLVSPQVTIAAGSTFSFWACAQDESYAAEHFGVAISDNGTSGWTMLQEWTMTAKGEGNVKSHGRDGNVRQGNWYNYTVDLSAYAGQKYIAIRHFNCYDQFILNVDDIELTAGRDANERHLEYYKVMCTSIDGVPIFNHNTVHPFCQLSTDEPFNAPLVEGEHYLCKVAVMYSTGMSAWSEPVEWVYEPCEHWGPVDEVTVGTTTQGNHIEWVFEHGFNPYGGDTPGPGPQPGGNTSFEFDFEGGFQGWTSIDADGDGLTWVHSSNSLNASGYDYTGLGHNSTNGFVYSQSYIDYDGAYNANNYLISPEKYSITANSVLNFFADYANDSYPDHFEVCVATADNPTPADFTMVWGGTAKSAGEKASVRHDNNRYENWRSHSVSLAAYAGQNVWIAFHHQDYDMYEIWIDDVTLTAGAKYAAPTVYSGMQDNGTYIVNIADIANYDERVYFLYNLSKDARFDVVADVAGSFIVSANDSFVDLDLEEAIKDFSMKNANDFAMMDKVQAAETAKALKSALPAGFVNAMMNDIYVKSRENNMCEFADPFCTDNGMYEFPAGVNAGSGETGPDYDCLYTQPNPAWYYMRIGEPGAMDIHMFSTPEVDIDFCCWGPFEDPTTPCPYGLTEDKVVSCSYSTSWTEHCMIPATAQTGEYYILVITNYSNQACNINFSMVAGSGSTDCGILPPVDIIGFLITQDGEYLAFAGPTDREYTDIDEFGDHEYCVRPIYPGEMTLPDHNYGWSMGCPVCEFSNGGPAACAAYMPIHGEAMPATDQVKIWWGDQNPGPGPQPGGEGDTFSYNFDDSQMPAGWTAHDEDGDGFGWILGTACDGVYLDGGNLGGAGHNSSADLVCSGSYSNVYGALTPDNWLISPTLTLGEGSVFSFWACGQDAGYVAEHFGVAVSEDDGNSFTMVQEWTMTAKNGGDVMTIGRNGNTRAQGSWHQYTVDLGAYAGEGRKIAIRHFNCTDMFILDVDDLELTNGSKSRADIVSFKVYRSADNNDYALIGTVPYVDGQTYYEYIDTPAGAGTYYYQVTTVYSNECESDPALSFDDPTQDYVVVGVTGLNENDGKVALFPNPTKGNVTIQATGMNHITVVSVLGQVVYDAEVDADEFTLNMSQFNAGMYTVRISTTDGVAVRRVTVIR